MMSDAVHGKVAPGFEGVERAFRINFASEHATPEVGAGFAVMRGDDVLVDLWGGHADRAKTRPWRQDTLVNTYSSTKGVASACTTLLESRGLIDYAAPVSLYWPAFAQAGKGEITVEMMLSHQGGLSGLKTPLTMEDLYDWEKMTTLLEQAEPLWEPGAVAGYHALTWGFLAGELVRRTDGRTIGRFLQEELATPLGADYFIGVPEAEDARVAEMIPPLGEPTQSLAEMSDILKLTLNNPYVDAAIPNERAFRAAELPALNGIGTAMGLARLYAPLANDGAFGGKQIYAPDASERGARRRFRGVDINLGVEVRWGAGFFGNNPLNWYGPHEATFGHSGWGGSMGFADPTNGISVGYVANQMDANLHGDPRGVRLVAALNEALS
jgi:CubicO group peptidase (beta-lactamase class C family)